LRQGLRKTGRNLGKKGRSRMKDNVAAYDPRRGGPAGQTAAPPGTVPPLGVYSEVGPLRAVLVCRPGRAHERLSPRICRELNFDAPLWVERAQRDFAEFVNALDHHGVEALELHTLLAQTLESAPARAWVLDRMLAQLDVAEVLGVELRAACDSLDAPRLTQMLIGGATLGDLGLPASGAMGMALALHPFVLQPLPHTLCLRDSHSWVHAGTLINHASWRGPRSESLLVDAVYRFHPRFEPVRPRVWWGNGAAVGAARPSADGGDVMTLGKGVVLIGTGARTQPQAAVQIARALFEAGAAQTVIAAQLPRPGPRSGPDMGPADALERIFTQCSPDVVTYRPDVVDRIACQELRPGAHGTAVAVQARAGMHLLDLLSEVLGAPTLNAIATGADQHDDDDAPWDDGNGALALEPGVVLGFERNARTNRRLRQAGVEVIEVPGSELARVGASAHALCCPIAREA
jgi:arginine deiminase